MRSNIDTQGGNNGLAQPGSRGSVADRVRVSGVALLVFLAGALSPLTLNVVGELYAVELVLPLAALIARFSRGGDRVLREPAFKTLLLAAFATLFGYMVSDLVQGTRPDQFLRGWGRVGLVVIDFISLAVIVGQDRRNLWWFVLGSGLGGIFYLRFLLHSPISNWKFGYSDPVFLATAALCYFMPLRAASVVLAGLGVWSMMTDYRSFAAICLLVAALVWIRASRRGRPMTDAGALKVLIAGGLAGAAILTVLSMTGEQSAGRRAQSDAGRVAAIEVGIEGIKRSPVIGHGSWVENKELIRLYMQRQAELMGGKVSASDHGATVFSPHSQILNAWLEGGILATAFMVVLLVQVLKLLPWTVLRRPVDLLTPALLFFLVMTLWNLFMSPFSAPHRVRIATGAAVVVLLRMEQRGLLGSAAAAANGTARPESPSPRAPAIAMARALSAQRRLRRLTPGADRLLLKSKDRRLLVR